MRMEADVEADWLTPTARAAVSASVRLPGSKSMTNRALILAILADEPTRITGPLEARDTSLMRAAVTALGASVAASPAGSGTEMAWIVTPGWRTGRVQVDIGNAGTLLRFVPPVAALASADVEVSGDPRASQRPVDQLLTALRQAGVTISDDGRGAVPFTVHGRGRVRGGGVTLDASESSQLVSGLMLAAPRYELGLEITHQGSRVPSAQHIAMTAAMLTAAGAEVETGTGSDDDAAASPAPPDHWRVLPGRLAPGTVHVEPDLSNAAPFLAAALVTAGRLTIPGWPAVSLQPAGQIIDAISRMGAECWRDAAGLHVQGTGAIHGISADLRDSNEVAPVLTALAALADSPSQFTGIGHMRFHESDRLAALCAEIGALGGDVSELPDGLTIRPRPLRAGTRPFDSYDDHRLVMAAAVLGLVVPGLRVRNPATVGKTFPEFRGRWLEMLGQAP
jgi:3-phosphoshikimate 1-carboxyvinyltransferase